MNYGCLAEVKISIRARWWFSTSASGGFRPDRKKAAKTKTYHRDTEARRKPEEIAKLALIAKNRRIETPYSGFAFSDQCHQR